MIQKIGTQLFLVHKRYVNDKLANGVVKPCKIKSYENKQGKILPILIMTGTKISVDPQTHYSYETLEEAVHAIDNEKTLDKPKRKKK
jgi:hypothetical protein